ncbi:hypothetical protein JJV70_15210 [Streptomyces sp. JJ66]|uniref:hypothetical protein n=1 Tax=Streptomyces sp. JJ66 TaxID=2803843 RepID=UPI001C576F3F|nr:hypothetical protein [Streptomyces sp. JJ66]MBW1603428.1 hypothetical protein [Streptomyces sp. JJ66]
MTPTEELRAAADKLRALVTAASTATATPVERDGKPTTEWHFAESRPGHGYLYAANPTGPGTRLMHADGPRTYPSMRTRHGAYAAAMDPALGAALAGWLDAEAARLAATAHPGWHDTLASPHALAIARLINGEPRSHSPLPDA